MAPGGAAGLQTRLGTASVPGQVRLRLPSANYRSIHDALNPLWERACSRMRYVIQHLCRLIGRFREQARSHRGLGFSDWRVQQGFVVGGFV